MSDAGFDPANDVRCDLCHESIGIYEPMIVFSQGTPVRTSRAASHDDARSSDARRLHAQCFADSQPRLTRG